MIIGIVACHRAPEVEPWPARDLGEFSYRTLVGATSVSGRFTILPDTVTMEAQQQACRRVATGVLDPTVHPFRCVGGSTVFNVTINSRQPLLAAWSTATQVKKTTEICMKYGFTAAGEKICTSSRTQVKTETVRASGPLEIKRIALADKP
jgi:hypothetical protein